MARRTGSADLPLHGGRVPPWLAERMASLGAVICQAIVHHYGRDEFLRRLSHPFWFQSFGAVMGMDWHSSGITTSVIGALKRGLAPVQGRARHPCLRRPRQAFAAHAGRVDALGERIGIDAPGSRSASRLVAKVDSAAVQDGFDLYLHGFFVTDDGHWTVVQQGMNGDEAPGAPLPLAFGNALTSFVDEPHSAIDGPEPGRDHQSDRQAGRTLRATAQLDLLRDSRARSHRSTSYASARSRSPRRSLRCRISSCRRITTCAQATSSPAACTARLAAAAERGPVDFPDLLLTPGVGARTVQSLAMVAEVVHGAPYRFQDPARFSLAHGGKDRHPYPVPIKVYDETIRVLKSAVQNAKLGNSEMLAALKRLDDEARRLESSAEGTSLESHIARERAASPSFGGRSVFGWEHPIMEKARSR